MKRIQKQKAAFLMEKLEAKVKLFDDLSPQPVAYEQGDSEIRKFIKAAKQGKPITPWKKCWVMAKANMEVSPKTGLPYGILRIERQNLVRRLSKN